MESGATTAMQRRLLSFRNAIASIPILRDNLSQEEQLSLANRGDVLSIVQFEPNKKIIQKHEAGSACYFIVSGSVTVINFQGAVRLGPKSYFGERALLRKEPRSATVIAEADGVTCVVIDGIRDDPIFKKLRGLLDRKLKSHCFETAPIFKDLDENVKNSVKSQMLVRAFDKGSTIFEEGSSGDLFYVVREGRIGVFEKGLLINIVEEGQYFGEVALVAKIKRTATCRAMTFCECFVISRNAFKFIVDAATDVQKEANANKVGAAKGSATKGDRDPAAPSVQKLAKGRRGSLEDMSKFLESFNIFQEKVEARLGDDASTLGIAPSSASKRRTVGEAPPLAKRRTGFAPQSKYVEKRSLSRIKSLERRRVASKLATLGYDLDHALQAMQS